MLRWRRAAPPRASDTSAAPRAGDTTAAPRGGDAPLLTAFSAWSRPVGYLLITVLMCVVPPRPGLRGRGLAITVALLVVLATAYADIFGYRQARRSTSRRGRLPVVLVLAVHGAACGVLAGLAPQGAAIALPFVAAGRMGGRLPTEQARLVAGLTAVVTALGLLLDGAELTALVALVGVGLATTGGQVRRLQLDRIEQSELLLAQSERARVADARNQALAERARIAREIHDVLAHSLSAISMQLELADALLGEGRTDQAGESVRRARALARQGMVETRHAVLALREDAPPLPQSLDALAASSGTELTRTGTPRPIASDAGTTIYRSMQEALTNARKHAPGARTWATLEYATDAIELTVTDSGRAQGDPARAAPPTPGLDRPGSLHDTGAGAGLAGMRERAELLGGSMSAGPHDQGWQVRVRLPI